MRNILIRLILGLLIVACNSQGTFASNPVSDGNAASPQRSAKNAPQPTQLPAASAAIAFSQVDDFNVQYRELVDYIDSGNQPGQITQVDLNTHRKVSQYFSIDSSPAGYGKNGCGLVAAAAALGGEDWIPLVAAIAQAAGEHYQPATGIQPSYFVAALGQAFGATSVRALDRGTLGDLYRELTAGHIVIVDVKLNVARSAPSAQPPNLAHFARVLGLDVDRQVIYLENTVGGDAYWTVQLNDFWAAWQQPETSASLILDPRHAEDVTRWAVVISGERVVARRSG